MVAKKSLFPVKNFPVRGCSLTKAKRVALVRKVLASPYSSGEPGARETTFQQEICRIMKLDSRK